MREDIAERDEDTVTHDDGLAVFDHVTPTGKTGEPSDADADSVGDVASGVYRVVGVDDESVTLLRLTDVDGTRRATGHLERVSRATVQTQFDAAENPDDGLDAFQWVAVAVVVGSVTASLLVPGVPTASVVVAVTGGLLVLWLRR